MIDAVINFFSVFPMPRLAIFIISLLPILELRGGLIAAAAFRVPLLEAFVICFLGNILPIPFILLFIKAIFRFMKKHGILVTFVEWLEKKAMGKSESIVNKQSVGLFFFVAIPLPGTGGWTGALIASMLNMPIKKSLPTIIAGVFCAGLIMIVLTYFIPELFGLEEFFQ